MGEKKREQKEMKKQLEGKEKGERVRIERRKVRNQVSSWKEKKERSEDRKVGN